MNKLHVAVNELENAVKKNADKTRLKPIFKKIEMAAKEPKTNEYRNERGENGIQALWRVFKEAGEDLKKDFQEFQAKMSVYQDAEMTQPSKSTIDILERAVEQVEDVADLRETLKATYQSGGKNIDRFKAYFEAYQMEKKEAGFPLSIRNIGEFAENLNDKQTLKNWYVLSQSLDSLESDGAIEKLDLNKISAKTAFSIVSQAWENLNQERSSNEDEEQEQRQS